MFRTLLALSLTLSIAHSSFAEIKFKKSKLDDKFRGEGVAVGDFNKDGKLDLATGEGYYAAPDWKLHPIREQAREFDPLKYSKCFQAWADDFNGDGWDDLLVVEFPGTPTVWLENPKGVARPWASHVAVPVTNNESPEYLDVDGDGKRELLCSCQADPKVAGGKGVCIALARPDADPTALWKVEPISVLDAPMTGKFYHGIGMGDLDGDKVNDVLTPAGWWKNPGKTATAAAIPKSNEAVPPVIVAAISDDADRPKIAEKVVSHECIDVSQYVFDNNTTPAFDEIVVANLWQTAPAATAGWKFTEAKLGEPCAQMHVYDFDGDGDADVLSTAAHKLGMWWHERTADGWQTHKISDLFSQTHALWHVDLNGDKLPDFITGKRYWAHGPKGDVDPGAPAVLYWFELAIKDGQPTWTPHEIDDDSGVGTQFQVTDVNGDGKVDIAIANKKGVFLFEQQ